MSCRGSERTESVSGQKTGGRRIYVDIPVEVTPRGWRIAEHPGRDLARAKTMLSSDLDVMEEVLDGYRGPGARPGAADRAAPRARSASPRPGRCRASTRSRSRSPAATGSGRNWRQPPRWQPPC